MARRWLLLLGSNLASDTCLREALEHLAALGDIHRLTSVRHLPASNGSARDYHNALATLTLENDVDAAALAPRLKQIESTLGRQPGDEVAIDIDILAADEDGRWKLDAHALAKHEFEQPHARILFAKRGFP